jgi:5'-3' exonuclease
VSGGKPSTLLLDSPSLIFRAYYALPASITDGEGQAVNAVRGYLDMVSHLIRTEKPSRVVHCFDASWRPQFRVDAFAGYKAQRLAPDGTNEVEPEDLTPQFAIIVEFLNAAGMEVAFAEGFEADDVIGTLAEAGSVDHPVFIVSGDRDLFQLVRDDCVTILFPLKGVKELRRVDDADVRERYGVPANRYADFAILRGDPSDGLPGLPGVGPKRAAELIGKYPSIDDLITGRDGQPDRLRASIAASAEYLHAMQIVVPVRRDAPVEMSRAKAISHQTLEALGQRYNAESPVTRLIEALEARN